MSRASRARSASAAEPALLLGQLGLRLGLAVEQPPRRRAGRGDERVERRLAEVGLERVRAPRRRPSSSAQK